MKITNPELKVVRFNAEDVIATSLYAVADGNGGYNLYEGTMGAYDANAGAWSVNLADVSSGTISAAEFDDYTRSLNSPYDIHSLYGAYKEGDYYFTKGATYVELYGEYVNVGGADPVNIPGGNPPLFP
ncbi:MAG: hypothetical protein IJQ07_00145 [Clostridia bacterium]|nr:hypothetical protein [Clostridia bacterium]